MTSKPYVNVRSSEPSQSLLKCRNISKSMTSAHSRNGSNMVNDQQKFARFFFSFSCFVLKSFFLSNLGGIAISIGFLLLFCVMVMTRKYIDDMFHSLRTHVCLTWILAMVMHIVTGNIGDTFGDNFKINLWVNFKVYFGDNCNLGNNLGTFSGQSQLHQ